MKSIFVELADTHIKRELGLMNRKHLSQNQGMLFKFPFNTRLSFWMKDTYIPLDIAFLDESGKILQIEEMVPLSTRPVYSHSACKYALEVNKGWFNKNDIKEGQYIGGRGISCQKKQAQIVPTQTLTTPPSQPLEGQDSANPPAPAPDVTLNMSIKERLDQAHMKGKDLIIIYQTKNGKTLPPKVISPPFVFEPDEDGHHDAVVKAWDNQDAGWKSFLIDNILNLEEKNLEKKKPEEKG